MESPFIPGELTWEAFSSPLSFLLRRKSSDMYQVAHSRDFGRYLIASQDIEDRTQIISERPLASGPADDETSSEVGDIPMCLGCSKRMTNCGLNRCEKCGWPVCDEMCEAAAAHAKNECELFRTNQVTYPCRHTWPILNKTIMVLRTMLLKTKRPNAYNEVIMRLEHHNEIRETKPYCKKGDEMILENFADFFKVDECDSEMRKEVLKISGIINVNAFSTTKTEIGNCIRTVQCLYSEASLLAHSCIPNCTWTVDTASPDLHIVVRSAIPIKKGEMITIAYNIPETMSGTLHRLISTEDVAHFICCCKRCADPTELGTFVSGVKCFHCDREYLLPKASTNPDSDWWCRRCGTAQRVSKIVLFLSQIEESFEQIKEHYYSREKEVNKLEMFLKAKGEILHQNHFILQEVRMRIIKLQVQSVDSLEEEEVEVLTKHCRFMMDIANILMPGFSKIRALLQFFLSQGLLRIAYLKSPNPYDEMNEETETKQLEVDKLYKEIHGLQTRALLYFTDQHSNTDSTSEANKFAKCIKRQLQNVERHI